MPELSLTVPEIHCDHCKTSIEGAVGTLASVEKVEVSIPDRTVHVEFAGPADRDAVVAAIEDQGYEVPA